jgi:PhoPQ-activated pathogenicity-related protein
MSNRLRTDIQDEEDAEKELIVEKKAPKEFSENYFTQLFNKGFLSTEAATKALPFILYVAFLGMLYIANRHLSEKNLREIDKLNKEVKELNWDYKSTKAELAFKSTLSEVEKRTDTLGIKTSMTPPQKLTIEDDSK